MSIETLFTLEGLFERLARENKPIAIYGMGDGAQKLLSVLNKYGLEPCAVFASDDFVRGQIFCGFKVETLAELESRIEDFTVLLAFGTSLPDVFGKISAISRTHELYAPDLNICGDPRDIFSQEYLKKNLSRFERMYSLLADDNAREMLISALAYKLTGKICFLERLSLLSPRNITGARRIFSYADLGAYTGDTILPIAESHPELKSITAFEPDTKTFQRLQKNIDCMCKKKNIEFSLHCAAAWSEKTQLVFKNAGGRNSALSSTFFNLKNKRDVTVEANALDNIQTISPDLIKIDVEGAEREALSGMTRTVRDFSPSLLVSLYHNYTDIIDLFEKVLSFGVQYDYYLDFPSLQVPLWDLRLCAMRKD